MLLFAEVIYLVNENEQYLFTLFPFGKYVHLLRAECLSTSFQEIGFDADWLGPAWVAYYH